MKVYFCDKCGKEAEHIGVLMPRISTFSATSPKGYKVATFANGIKLMETDMCHECLKAIANLFPEIEEK